MVPFWIPIIIRPLTKRDHNFDNHPCDHHSQVLRVTDRAVETATMDGDPCGGMQTMLAPIMENQMEHTMENETGTWLYRVLIL